jgi:hypothetical protein
VWERTFDIDSSDSWLRSPLFALIESKAGELRRRLNQEYRRGEFPLLDELQDEGCTDYIAVASSFGERARLGEVEGSSARSRPTAREASRTAKSSSCAA